VSVGGARACTPREAALLTALVLLGVGYRLALLDGPSGGDDVRYLGFAAQLFALERVEVLDHAAGRLLLLATIGAPLRLFGHAYFVSLTMAALATTTDVLATRFVLRSAGPRAAILAAAMLAACPLGAFYGTRILPDTPLATWTLLATLAFVEGRSRLVVALLVGAAYLTKDPGVLLLPPLGLAVLLGPGAPRRKAHALAMLALGFAAALGVEALAAWAFTGDPAFRMHATAAAHNAQIGAMDLGTFVAACGDNLSELVEGARFTLLPVFLGVPAFVLLALRGGPHAAIGLVGGFFVAFLLFGTSSLTKLVALPFHVRYFQPVAPLAAIAIALLAAPLLEAEGRPRAAPALAPTVRAGLVVGAFAAAVLFAGLQPAIRLGGYAWRAPYLAQLRDAVELLDPAEGPLHVEPCLYRSVPWVVHESQRARLVAMTATLTPGLYLLPATLGPTSCTDTTLEARVRALPVRMRVSRDYRPHNRLRWERRWKPYEPALVVYARTASAADAPR
jgi:hypothetical protein